jgi:hypothetical protein
VTTAKEAGTLRRVLGTIVALMLAGSALGLMGALIFPERQVPPPSWKDADRRTRERAPERVRLNVTPPIGRDQRKVKNTSAPAVRTNPVRPTRL